MKFTCALILFVFPFFLGAQTVDSTAIKKIDSLIQVSFDLTKEKNYDEALAISEIAENIALEKFGQESAEYGRTCYNHGRVLDFQGYYATANKQQILTEAEKWYIQTMLIFEATKHTDHPDYASTLLNLGVIYRVAGKYGRAEPLLQKCRIIREKIDGKEHPSYASILCELAFLYRYQGKYEQAEPLFLEAIPIIGKNIGKETPHYAYYLNALGNLYGDMGKYEKAEPPLQKCKVIREKIYGKEHYEYAFILHNMGYLYARMGQYERAEPLYLESRAIIENTHGREHTSFANNSNNLAILYKAMGQYNKAETLYLEAKSIREATLGNKHPDYAQSIENLAILYDVMGQYERAEPLYLEAQGIQEYVHGKEHPHYGRNLENLALMHQSMGKYEKAESLYFEAQNILVKTLGKEHPDYARILGNQAVLHKATGEHDKAESLYLEAYSILDKKYGKEHPLFALNLNNQAILYHAMGEYDKAESLYLEAYSILDKKLGKNHPYYAAALNGLATLYRDLGEYNKAEPFFLEHSKINKLLIDRAVHHLSERDLGKYLSQFQKSQHKILSFAQLARSEKLTPACYNNSLFYKGFLLQASNRLRKLALSNETTTEQFNLLKGYQRRLAALYAQPIAERDSALVAQLEIESNDIEKELARTVAGWGQARQQVKWHNVQAALQTGEAAVEFVHYRYYGKEETDSTMYAALLVKPGQSSPSFIPLFEERTLDSLLSPHGERKADYVNQLYSIADRGLKPIRQSQKTLYEIIWQPLEKELEGIQTIYYSNSGLLHRLNLGAIPITEDETLADRYSLVSMNSTRQLVIPDDLKPAEQDGVLYGGIQYEMDSTAIAAANQGLTSDLFAVRGELTFSYSDASNRGGKWNYLSGTEKEVNQLTSILTQTGNKVAVRKGYAATEESFETIGRQSASPRIIHLATHGYFFQDIPSQGQGETEPVFKLSDHPMIRSGLILAGGNYAWQTGKPLKPNMEDGILTAYEISQMDLSHTELVVLSACETGLGEIKGNEGVYGLQRAFKIAGAKYLIMSLWQVPDKQTSILMKTFYKKWLEEKMEIPEAFRAAQMEMRDFGFDPYQWAGFVLLE